MDDMEYAEFVEEIKGCLGDKNAVEYFEKNLDRYEADIKIIIKKKEVPLIQTLFSAIEADFGKRNDLPYCKHREGMLAVARALETNIDPETTAFFKERLWTYAKYLHVAADRWEKKDEKSYGDWYRVVLANVRKDFNAEKSKKAA